MLYVNLEPILAAVVLHLLQAFFKPGAISFENCTVPRYVGQSLARLAMKHRIHTPGINSSFRDIHIGGEIGKNLEEVTGPLPLFRRGGFSELWYVRYASHICARRF